MRISNSGVIVQNGAQSALEVEVKENEDRDRILLQHNSVVHNHTVEVFSKWGDGILRYQGRFCVPYVGELRQHIIS